MIPRRHSDRFCHGPDTLPPRMGTRWAVLVGLWVLGCGTPSESDAGTDGGRDASTGVDTSIGDAAVLAGAFQVRLVPPVAGDGGFTSVVGKVYDGPNPELLVWEKQASDGDCTLLTPRVPFCTTPCGGSAACVANDTCQAYPSSRSVGTVHVTGLGASDFTMSPVVNTYQPAVTLPFPAFAANDVITFEAAGGSYAPFSISSRGIDPLELTNSSLVLTTGQAVTLTWTPPTAGSATVHVKLDISHHGGSKGKIDCTTADDGSLTLGAALLTPLLNLGVAGFPSIVVSRNSVGSAVIAPGRVDLTITSDVERAVQIPGLASCTNNADCPDGGTCKTDLTCQ